MKHSNDRHNLLVLFVLLLAIPVIYSNTLDVPFHFDDKPNILSNPSIRLTEPNMRGLADAAWESHLRNRPVSNISFALNYFLHRYEVTGYHVANILIHLMTGIALFFFLQSTFRTPALRGKYTINNPIPLLAALLWAVHPLHTQSVTYIVQRMNSLAGLFYVLCLLFYVRGRLTEADRRKWPWFAGCVLWGILALGSKEIAATLPFFLLLYEWYFIQDLGAVWFKKFLAWTSGSLVLIAGMTILYLGQNRWHILVLPPVQAGFSTMERLATQSRVVLYYVSLLLFPHPSRLNLDYDFPVSRSLMDPMATLFSVFIIASLLVFACYAARKERLISFAIFWFFGNLAIESTVASLEMVYEHRTYLPSMFFVLAVVLLAYRSVRHKKAVYVSTLSVFLLFSFWTYQRNGVWNDPVALWKSSAEKSVTKARPYNNLGIALSNVGRVEEAIACYREALRRDPDYYVAHISIGAALMATGKLDEAVSHYTEALRAKPDYAPIHQSLGIAFTRKGDLDKALFHYQEALRLDLNYADAHHGMGVVLARQGRIDEAVSHYQKALAIEPGHIGAKTNLSDIVSRRGEKTIGKPSVHPEAEHPTLGEPQVTEGIALATAGRLEEAVRILSEALKQNPGSAQAYFNRAVALYRLNRLEEAVKDYMSVLQIQPAHAEAHNNLGIILAVKGDMENARDHFSAALKARPEFTEARNNLERAENLLRAGP